jgi:hypothetical protein
MNPSTLAFAPVVNREDLPTGVEAAVDGDFLYIKAPINQRPSKTFKNILLASTSGNGRVKGVQFEGKEITIGLNAYVPPTRK